MEPRAGGEVQGGGFVGFAGDVARADYRVPVREAEVEQGGLGDASGGEEGVEAGDGVQHGGAEEGVAEAGGGGVFQVGAEGV